MIKKLLFVLVIAFTTQSFAASIKDSYNRQLGYELPLLVNTLREIEFMLDVESDYPGGDDPYICAMEKSILADFQCVDPAYFFIDNQANYIIQCYKNGDISNTSDSYCIEGNIDVQIAKYLKLLNIKGTYTHESQNVVMKYTCQNLDTGELYSGTLQQISEKYKRYLQNR